MKIYHSILHVFDFTACVNTFAYEELDPTDKKTKSYVAKHVKKALANLDNMHGEFVDGSMFAQELRRYFRKENDFVDLSVQIAEFIAEELGHQEKSESTDLLVVDFEDDMNQNVRDMSESEAEAAYQGRGKRYFAFLLLESKPAYVHQVDRGDSGQRNDISYSRTVLPSPSQKVGSYAIVDADTLGVSFVDKKRTIAGEECWLIPDKLLQCTMEASSKECFSAVTELVEAVAEEYGQNAAVALARTKAYVSQDTENPFEDDKVELDIEGIAEEVFADIPEAKRRFEDAVQAKDLPERIPVERKAVSRMAKNHKIRTDTGIEITFPAEYGQNPEFMVFTSEADGTYSISLKNINHIENR